MDTRAPNGYALPNLLVKGKPAAPQVNGRAWFVRIVPVEERRCTVTNSKGEVSTLPIGAKPTDQEIEAAIKRRAERLADFQKGAERVRLADTFKRRDVRERTGKDLIHTPRALAPLDPPRYVPDEREPAQPRQWRPFQPLNVGGTHTAMFAQYPDAWKAAPTLTGTAPDKEAEEKEEKSRKRLDALVSVGARSSDPIKVGALTAEQRRKVLDGHVRLSAHERKRLQRLERTARLEKERKAKDAKALGVTQL